MDDVVLLHEDPAKLQKMLDITDKIAKKYHLVFGEEKSKIMTIGTTTKPQLNLGSMNLEQTNTYKYLGELITNNKSMENHINEARRKAEAAYHTILTIAADPQLRGIQMETIWKLIETCIVPIITYGAETWRIGKKERTKANKILDDILKRILKTPITVPREALYIETGLIDVEHTTIKNTINMANRLHITKNKMLESILQNRKQSWTNKVNQEISKQNIDKAIVKGPRNPAKTHVQEKIKENFKRTLEKSKTKSKIKFLLTNKQKWEPMQRPAYMNKLSREQISIIFKTRTRMIDVKNNFRSKYTDIICRGCGQDNETQEHVLETCTKIHPNDDHKVSIDEIFTEDTNILTKTAEKIREVMKKLLESEANP